MNYRTIRDIDLSGKTVLLRGDLNVPSKDRTVTDTTRIDRLGPTVKYLTEHGARVLLLSHFGRPKGARNEEYSLRFLTATLTKQWGMDVVFADDCIGEPAKALADSLLPGQIGLLENTRFHKGEEANDPGFVRALAEIGDIYVNDAFSAAHRAHASTEGIAHILPAFAGFLMEAELDALGRALENPERPLAAIVGGAKISTKLELLGNLVEKTDMLVLGGGMANTFLFAQGIDVKSSLCEADMAAQAVSIIEKAAGSGCELILPVDGLAALKFEENAPCQICDIQAVPEDHMLLDIGPQTIEMLKGKLQGCATVVWNGPMGAFEIAPFDRGTNELAQHVASLTQSRALVSVAGGGDTVAALEHAGVKDDFSYVSTAGGAFLEWLEGKTLPGVAALTAYQDAA